MHLVFLLFAAGTLQAADRPEVTGTMRSVFTALMNLQPYAVSSERFKDPKNKKVIEQDLKMMATIKHAFPKAMTEEEPGVAAISKMFVDYLKDVQVRYKNGDFEYARHRVRTATGFCFSCHSRLTTSKNFEDFEKRVENTGLTTFEKAEIYSATRQFDKSLKLYQEFLASKPKDTMGLIQYLRGLRHALSVTVRVKRSPTDTNELLEAVMKRSDLPEYVKRFSQQWKKDTQFWLEEKKDEAGLSGEKMVEKARMLIERAQTIQGFPADENGDISYLRATNYLHEALDSAPKAKFRGEALYLLGVSYYSLQDPMLWDLDRVYFESCIREFPKTSWAQKCFKRYSDKIYLGYTGSAGTNIPEDELKKLDELRKLSES